MANVGLELWRSSQYYVVQMPFDLKMVWGLFVRLWIGWLNKT